MLAGVLQVTAAPHPLRSGRHAIRHRHEGRRRQGEDVNTGPKENTNSEDTTRRIPTDFMLGAATASYQIEGAVAEGGRLPSIWDTFCRVPGAIITGENGDVACDHYHRYREDVGLMREMGLDSYRFSVAWPRIYPDGKEFNQEGADFYNRLVDELLEADILPWLTLYHWDLPQALQDRGGWLNRDTTDRFTDYALRLHEVLGDRVQNWTTLNEPWCSSFLSHTAGIHAPGETTIKGGLISAHHLLLAHGKGISALRSADANLNLGITLNLTVAEPADPQSEADLDAARRIDGQFNRWFLDPVLTGAYPKDIPGDIAKVDPGAVEEWDEAVRPGDLETIATPIDFLGINYYHAEYVSGTAPAIQAPGSEAPVERHTRSPFPSFENIYWPERNLPRTAMGWEVDPDSLTTLLGRISKDYTHEKGVPLYVTENGAAFDDFLEVTPDGPAIPDADREQYLRRHIKATLDAREAGVDVRGFFYWSLMDNFEWAWGYQKRFGIIGVDYQTQDRTVKQSGKAYSQIIAGRAV